MPNLNERDLLCVRLKAVSYIPGIGNLGPTLTSGINKGLAKLSLQKVDGGVFVKGVSTDGPYKDNPYEAFIPNQQIEIMQFKLCKETSES